MKFVKVEPYGGYEKKLSPNWKTFWGQCKPLENVTTQEHSMVFPIHFLISIYHDQIGKFILAKSISKQRDSQNERQIKCQQIKWENVWILLSSQSPWQINKFLIDDPLCIGQCPFNMEIILRIKKNNQISIRWKPLMLSSINDLSVTKAFDCKTESLMLVIFRKRK